ncbi:MAG: cysteine-rich CWC family protein [Pedobacter sp.]|nr:cysteine-rich CWC family protein [Pedobacter sp.]
MKKDHKHEAVKCERCNIPFECKVGTINLCQCQAVALNIEQRNYIRYRYDDCLCANCLKELRKEYNIAKFNDQLNSIMMRLGRK